MQKKFGFSKQFFKDVWGLTKSYWQSEEKGRAFFLLACIVGLTLGIVYLLVLLNRWNNSFYSALQNYETGKIFDELIHFSYLAAIYIILAVYSYYLQQCLVLRWRQWLTGRFLDVYLADRTYYQLQMFGLDTDNPDQRISEDVRLFVEMSLSFAVGILRSLCTFVSFVFILYELSGSLEFDLFGRHLSVDGYLFWASLLYSVIGTYITHLVGKKLVGLNFVQQRFEADFRYSMIRLRESSENVAFYRGEEEERQVFDGRFTSLLKNFRRLIDKQKQLVWLNSGYSQIAIIFPFVAAMQRYLAKEITLGGLMQVSSAFGNVQGALSYFADMYASIAEWQAVVMRLTLFGRHMQQVGAATQRFHLERFGTAAEVEAQNLQITLPDGTPLLEKVDFVLEPGQNVIVKGKSGAGKSTLLRVLAGIWPFVNGKILLPPQKESMFIPQRPYIPLGTLRQALLYPGAPGMTDDGLKKLMELCRIGHLAEKLNEEADWSHMLSIGEQQRLAFVRVHVQKPRWLFLDEATSALDEETEAEMYELLAEKLPGTTVVSVGHRSTLDRFHRRILRLDKEKKTVRAEEAASS